MWCEVTFLVLGWQIPKITGVMPSTMELEMGCLASWQWTRQILDFQLSMHGPAVSKWWTFPHHTCAVLWLWWHHDQNYFLVGWCPWCPFQVRCGEQSACALWVSLTVCINYRDLSTSILVRQLNIKFNGTESGVACGYKMFIPGIMISCQLFVAITQPSNAVTPEVLLPLLSKESRLTIRTQAWWK